MSPPVAAFYALVDKFLPPGGVDSVERVRARFFVIGSVAIACAITGVTATYAVSPEVGVWALAPMVALLVPTVAFPFLLRRGVSLEVLAALLIVLIQGGLTWSAVMDRGLEDVAFLWLVASPMFAALTGGTRLAGLSVLTVTAGATAVLVLAESGHVFPDLMDPAFARRYHVANVAAAGAVVATFAWLYEGPLLARAQALAARLRTANEALRHELEARRAAQARAEAASRAKGVLLANLSHEFRTPLTGVLCALDILSDGVSPDDREVIEAAESGAHRLLATLNDVIDLVDIESQAPPPSVPTDIAALARRVVGEARPKARGRGLALRVEGQAVRAVVPAPWVERLIGVLVHNAVRFTEQGEVVVEVWREGDDVRLAVADTGPGMPSAVRARATEPFVQGSEGEARSHEGLGLGLTLADRLARAMDGTLAIDSEPGQGTTVHVAVPDRVLHQGDGLPAFAEVAVDEIIGPS